MMLMEETAVNGKRKREKPEKKGGAGKQKKNMKKLKRKEIDGGAMMSMDGGMMGMGGMTMDGSVDKSSMMMGGSMFASSPSSSIDHSPSFSKNGSRMICVGNRVLEYGENIIEMTDSTSVYQEKNYSEIRRRLSTDGYVLIRGVINSKACRDARSMMIDHLSSKGAILQDSDHLKEDAFIAPIVAGERRLHPGWTIDAESGGVVGGREPDTTAPAWRKIARSKTMLDVYWGKDLHTFFGNIFAQSPSSHQKTKERMKESTDELPKEEEFFGCGSSSPTQFAMLPNCTWLRAKGHGEVTAEHADYYYFRKFTDMFSVHHRQHEPMDEKEINRLQTCQICNNSDDGDETIICDLCNRGYHFHCLTPALHRLPIGDWHCNQCADSPMPFFTCWMALGKATIDDGLLAVHPETQTINGYNTPIRTDLLPGHYDRARENVGKWHIPTEVNAGDIIVFNIKTIHAASKNVNGKFRISIDTRVTCSQYLDKPKASLKDFDDDECDEAKEAGDMDIEAKKDKKNRNKSGKSSGNRKKLSGK